MCISSCKRKYKGEICFKHITLVEGYVTHDTSSTSMKGFSESTAMCSQPDDHAAGLNFCLRLLPIAGEVLRVGAGVDQKIRDVSPAASRPPAHPSRTQQQSVPPRDSATGRTATRVKSRDTNSTSDFSSFSESSLSSSYRRKKTLAKLMRPLLPPASRSPRFGYLSMAPVVRWPDEEEEEEVEGKVDPKRRRAN